MRQVPPWHIAPFGAPAAFDVNLCTDSVLPGSLDPVRLRYAGLVATSLLHSLDYWNAGWGRSLPLHRNAILQS
jgi:hypothetical protein